MANKRDVIIDREDLNVTRFYLKTEDATAWLDDNDDLVATYIGSNRVIEVAHESAAEIEDRMRDDGLSIS